MEKHSYASCFYARAHFRNAWIAYGDVDHNFCGDADDDDDDDDDVAPVIYVALIYHDISLRLVTFRNPPRSW